MNKEIAPYPESLELKELGFDEPCFGYWSNLGTQEPFLFTCELGTEKESCYIRRKNYLCKGPTYSKTFRWFREYEDWPIESWIQPYLSDEPRQYEAFYWRRGEKVSVGVFSTYDEAQLGLLRKLIEIVKTKQ